MRFTAEPPPCNLETRCFRKFMWFPVTLQVDGTDRWETRWLETAEIKMKYHYSAHYGGYWSWESWHSEHSKLQPVHRPSPPPPPKK